MAPASDQRYYPAPPIPSYDEAVAGGSWQQRQHDYPHSPVEYGRAAEGQSLLTSRHPFSSSSSPSTSNQHVGSGRRPGGYRAPTVETDDEGGLLSSDSETDSDTDAEADHVRREMQEMDIDDSGVHGEARGRSTWGKRIGFSLSLPQWRWRWRLPRIPFGRGRTTTGSGAEGAEPGQASGNSDNSRASWLAFPSLGSAALFLIVGRVLAILLVMGFLYLLFASDLFTNMARRMNNNMFDPIKVRNHVKMSIDPRSIRGLMQHYTGYAHIAGTEGDFALAEDTELMFRRFGLEDVTRDTYYVYLNYPKEGGRAVEILGGDGKPTWSAKLEEDDPGGEKAGHQTMAFHGHSKSGDVSGPLLYANYGTKDDYRRLKELGIDTQGAIALVRYGGQPSDRALKVKEAEKAGFAGCLIYSDPADDGFVKGDTAPNGPYMPADGVQRGAVSLMSYVVGDVLTPGWGSRQDQPRLKPEESPALPKIPSLPLAWRDAQILLQHIKEYGVKVPEGWAGGVPDIGQWWTGNSTSPTVRLKNEQDEVTKQPIWNVYGKIIGVEQPEKRIIIGNHRDSWGPGAADPHSGTAVMLELIRIFGDLLADGWRPLRTIEFMSWDGEEYNLIGSTEYVEQNDELLRNDGFAYINLDTAVTGSVLHAAGSPMFNRLLLEVLNDIQDPVFNGTSLRSRWDDRHGELEGLGAGSDYVAFQDIVGMSSLDLHFDGPAYPAHSSYETFDWMDQVGDPGFVYHTLLGQLVGRLILELADRPILPFDMAHYSNSLGKWISELEAWVGEQKSDKKPAGFSVQPLKDAHHDIVTSIREFNKWELSWEGSIISSGGFEPAGLGRKRCEYNARMARFETDLLDEAGIPNRTQFKHVVFGPQLESSYDEEYFPSIRDTIRADEWEAAGILVERVANIIKNAGRRLIE
ncbi:hypothetical protein QBC47DRAFT_151719 [Echria macrotheca]|uniref:Glutamate carboxypeptidase n=1 Tax=Echria macrotheca TaxID=438768 RepID=A0AAJ0F5V4_9PEZI|nr:hypothetical protein QBC47DRAFT_151719 [Echria macrotheca]